MHESSFFALFLVGLLGGTHCVGMCGGIVEALSVGGGNRPSLHLAYNAGRIASYAAAGALAGTVGEAGIALAGTLPVRTVLSVLANLMLVALGLYLLGVTRALAFTERAGQHLWRHIQPLTRRFVPAKTIVQAFPLGVLWGWLPCGLVYSASLYALGSGSAAQGGLYMLAFALGTLPNLLAMGFFAGQLKSFLQHRSIRLAAGLLVAAWALWQLLQFMRHTF